MEEVEDKLTAWLEMDSEERQKWNGYLGFCEGELFKDDNAFMIEYKDRLKRRVIKDRKAKENKK